MNTIINQYTNSKLFNKMIAIIYEKKSINHTELSEMLGVSNSSLTNNIYRYSTINPPLIRKIKQGKYTVYTLTDEGKQYYLEKVKYCDNEIISLETKKLLVNFILKESSSSNAYFHLLKTLDINIICKYFSVEEFCILCQELDVLSKNNNLNEKHLKKKVLNKLKLIIDSDLDKKINDEFTKSL